MTNLDRVKNMDIDGIVAFKEMICPPDHKKSFDECLVSRCPDCWRSWLNKEVEE